MGDRSERVFVGMFVDTDHWWAQRAAASGSSTEADLPDVTFSHGGTAFAAEEKTTSDPYIYVGEEEVEQLEAYADAYGMQALILGRFKGERAFYAWRPDRMERTDAGTYRGSPGDEEWGALIAEPDGTADGIYPSELTAFALYHAVNSHIGEPLTAPPENAGLVDEVELEGETDG